MTLRGLLKTIHPMQKVVVETTNDNGEEMIIYSNTAKYVLKNIDSPIVYTNKKYLDKGVETIYSFKRDEDIYISIIIKK